jgi:plastocyanin
MFPLSVQRTLKIFGFTLAVPLSLLLTLTALLDQPTVQAQPRAVVMSAMSGDMASMPAMLPATADPAALSGLVDVAIFNFGFSPAVITITAGSTVRWTNTASLTPHTTTSDLGDPEAWNSGTLNPGDTFTHTFDTPGIYGYYCLIHGALFMHGFVIVPQPPVDVDIAGPGAGEHGNLYTFTAAVNPITTTLPITFSWEATNQLPITHVNAAISDTIGFSWTSSLTGAQWITVTASNATGSALDTHLILIDPSAVYLPIIMRSVGP